jgi:hypothetical protein
MTRDRREARHFLDQPCPFGPLPTLDAAIGAILGWAVPPMALTHDLHGMYGWEEEAATIDRIYQSLPANRTWPSDRARRNLLASVSGQRAPQ